MMNSHQKKKLNKKSAAKEDNKLRKDQFFEQIKFNPKNSSAIRNNSNSLDGGVNNRNSTNDVLNSNSFFKNKGYCVNG